MLSDFELLLELALLSRFQETKTTTLELADKLNVSQQSISRKMIILDRKNLIDRNTTHDGITFTITEKGRRQLLDKHRLLKEILDSELRIEGRVTSGLGEGKYYMSLPGYRKSISLALGFEPYPGTLNLKVDPVKASIFISSLPKIEIRGFSQDGRTFGALESYPVRINGHETGAIIIPERTHHGNDILEIISGSYLRKGLSLKDEDTAVLSR